MLHVLIILVVTDVKCQENYFGFHCEQKRTFLEYQLCYNDGQCGVDGEHYYCEYSSNFRGISK